MSACNSDSFVAVTVGELLSRVPRCCQEQRAAPGVDLWMERTKDVRGQGSYPESRNGWPPLPRSLTERQFRLLSLVGSQQDVYASRLRVAEPEQELTLVGTLQLELDAW